MVCCSLQLLKCEMKTEMPERQSGQGRVDFKGFVKGCRYASNLGDIVAVVKSSDRFELMMRSCLGRRVYVVDCYMVKREKSARYPVWAL